MVYEADDDGYSLRGPRPVPAGDEDRARLGAANCPEDAITIEEGA
jgi:ferredoxin